MRFMLPSGRGLPIRDVLGKSKMILGLLEGIPTMHKAEIAMVTLETFVKIRSCPCKSSKIMFTLVFAFFCFNICVPLLGL